MGRRAALAVLPFLTLPCAQAPAPAADRSMPAAIAAGTARDRAAAPRARCEAAGPLALSCVEQLDADHFTAVDIRAERLPAGAAGGDAAADRPTIGPGGGGRYRRTTADGAFAVTAVVT